MKKSMIRRLFRKWAVTGKSERDASGQKLELENLEPRMLFSAAPVEAPAEGNPDQQPAAEESVDTPEAAGTAQEGQAGESTLSGQSEEAPLPVVSRESAIEAAQLVSLVDLDQETERLNQETLDAIAESAAERWRATGLTGEQSAALDLIEYGITDFADGSTLGSTEGFRITVDDDGSAKGWFSDERGLPGATSGIDLLSVLLHEQGHILGVGHSDTSGDVMFDILSRGERNLPVVGQAEGAAPGEVISIEYIHAGITTRTWTGGAGNGLWNDAGNWSGADVPDSAGEEAHFSGNAPGAIDLGGASIGIGALHFSSLIGAYTIENGTLDVAGILQENGATNTISAELDTAGITAHVSGGTLVLDNQDNDATGTVTVGTGATLSAALDGTGGALGDLDVDLSGGTLEILPGALETIAGAQAYLFNGNDTDLPGDSSQLATKILGGDVWFPDQNSLLSFWGDDLLGLNNSGNPVDPQNFGHTYVGTFIPDDGDANPGETLTVEFGHTSADDANRIRIDLNGNSTFENVVAEGDEDPYDGDRGGTYATAKDLMLVEGQSYLVMIQGREGGGGVSLRPRVSFDNGATWQDFDGASFLTTDAVPEGTMNGTVTVSGSSSIDLTSTVRTTTVANLVMTSGATLTVDSADMEQGLNFSNVEVQGGDANFAGTGMPEVTLSNITETAPTNLVFNGDSVYTLDTANTFSGTTTINNDASVIIGSNGALGSETGPADGTTVNAGGALVAQGITTIESLTINGGGNAKYEGALAHRGGSGNTFWNGDVTVAGDAEIRSFNGNELFFDAGTTTIASGAELTLDADNRLNYRTAATITGDSTTTLQISGTDRVDMETTIPNFDGTINVGSDGSDGHEIWGRFDVHAVDGGFGSSTGDTHVRGGEGSVIIRNSRTHNENFFIEGNGRGTEGAIRSEGGTNTIVGDVTLTDNADIYTNNSTLTIDGAVMGGGFQLNKLGTNTTSRLILTQDSVNLSNLDLGHGQIRIQTEGGLGGTTSLDIGAGEAVEFDPGDGNTFTFDGADPLQSLNIGGGTIAAISGTTILDTTQIGVSDINFGGDGDLVVNQGFGNGDLSLINTLNTSISGLELWLDAGDIDGAGDGSTGDPGDGATVTTWVDKSGNSRDASRGGATPTVVASAVNGLTGIDFDGNLDHLNVGGTQFFAKEQYVIFRSSHPTWDADNGGSAYGAVLGRTSGRGSNYLFENHATDFHTNQQPASVSRNGIDIPDLGGSSDFNVAPIDEYMMLRIEVNNGNANPGSYYVNRSDHSGADLEIAEIIAFDHSLSGGDKVQVESYLLNKYNLGGGATNNVTKSGGGTLTLAGDNNFNGAVNIIGGTVVAAHDNAFGIDGGDITLSSGATVAFMDDGSGGIDITGENLLGADGSDGELTESGTNSGITGTIVNLSGNNSFDGDITASDSPPTQDVTISSASGTLTLDGSTLDVQFSKLSFDGAGDVVVNSDITGETTTGFGGLAKGYLFTGNDVDLPGDGSQISTKPIANREIFFPQEANSLAFWGDDLLGVGNAGNPVDPNNWGQSFVGTLILDDGDANSGEAVQVKVRTLSNDDAATIYIDQDFDGLDTGDSVPPFNANGSGGSPTSGTINLTEGVQYTVMLGAREGGGGSRLQPEISVDNGTTWQRFDLVDANTNGFQFGTELNPMQELMKMGSGTVSLNGDNGTYDADYTVMDGTLVAGSDNALGTTGKGTSVESGATLNITATNVEESEIIFGDRITMTPNSPLPSLSMTANASDPLRIDVVGSDTESVDLVFDIAGTGLPGADNKFVLDQDGTERRVVDIGDTTPPDSVDLPGGTVTFDDVGSSETFNTGAWSLTTKAVFNEFYWTGAISSAWGTAGNWVDDAGTVATSTPDDISDAAYFVHNGGMTSGGASVTVSNAAVTLSGDTIGGMFLENSAATNFTFSGGTLMTNGLAQTGAGTNTFTAGSTLTSSLFNGIVEAGTLVFADTGNTATLTDGEWHIKTGATLDVAASGAASGLGAGDVDVFLDGGVLDIDGLPATSADALGHYGYHINNDGLALDLNNNGGMMGGGDPTSFTAFEGLGLLTTGPGNRGLDFNNDADFRAVPASILDDGGDGFVIDQNDNYSNLWLGHFTPDVDGAWEFRRASDDDRTGIWFDINQNGVFESSTPGLGSNRGEQLAWEDGGWKTVNLTAGQEYLVAFTHREGGGGSNIDYRFRGPAGAAVTTDTVIRPGDGGAQAAADYWSFTYVAPSSLTNDVIVTTDNSTVDVSAGVELGGLTFNDSGHTLNFDGGGGVEFTDTGSPTQSVSVEGETTFNTANGTTITLNGIAENNTANLTYSGDGSGRFNLPEDGVFDYTGTTTIDNTTVFAEGTTVAGDRDGLDQLGTTDVGTTVRNGGEFQFSGNFDVGNESRAVQEDFNLEGGGTLRHTGGGNAQLYSDITIGGGGGTIANDGNEFRTRTTVQTGGNDLTLESNSTIRFDGNGNIQGGADVVSSGNGYTVLNHANDIGTMTVSNGRLQINHDDALGGTGDTTVQNGGTLQINGTRNITENVTIEGNGEGNEGAIRSTGSAGFSTLDGTVTLTGDSRFRIETDLNITGLVSGTGNLEKNLGGDLRFEQPDNTWDGTTTIDGGRLIITSADGLGLNDAVGPNINNAARLAFDSSSTSDFSYDASTTTITSGGFDNIDGHNKLTGTAGGSGDLYFGADAGQFDLIGNIADSLSGDVVFDGVAGEINVVNSFGAGSLGTISTLTVTSGLQLWLDAQDIDGAGDGATGDPGNGATVTTWVDKSGNNRDASRGAATPTVVSGAVNGLTGIDFDGNLDHLNVGGTQFFAKEQYVIFRSSHPTWDADNGGSAYGAVLGRTSGRGSNYLFENHATDFHTNQQPASVSRNGVDVPDLGGASDFNVGPIDEYMMLRIEVNNNNPNPGSYYVNRSDHSGADLEIAEIIAYDSTLNGADRQQVEAYLLNKYNLPGATRDIIKNGGSTVNLLADNDHNGATIVNDGTLVAASDMALGASSAEVIINDGGTVALSNQDYDGGSMSLVSGADADVTVDQVTINQGTGASNRGGAISNIAGNNTLNIGTATVADTATVVSFGSEADLLTIQETGGGSLSVDLENASLAFGGAGNLDLNANFTENNGTQFAAAVTGSAYSGNAHRLPGTATPLNTVIHTGDVYFSSDGEFSSALGVNLGDNYGTSFVGTLRLDTTTAIQIRANGIDDGNATWIDLDQDGSFSTGGASGNERLYDRGHGNQGGVARTLTGGESYTIALLSREGGGSSRLQPEISFDGGSTWHRFTPGRIDNQADFGMFVNADQGAVKTGTGTVTLLGDNNTGLNSTIDIQDGTLVATNATSLGGGDADGFGTTVAGTATLALDPRGGAAFTLDEDLTVQVTSDDPSAGAGFGGMGVISNIAGDNTYSGDLNIVAEGLPPFHMDGLEAWYDATTISLNDGDTVTAWEDSSGNNRDLVSWTGTPTFETNEINGMPAVRFNANNENLQMADPSNHYFANDVFLIFRAGQDGTGPTRTTFGPDWGAPIGVKDGNDANRTWMLQGNEDRFWSSELPSAVRRDGVDISSANNFDMGGIDAGQYMMLQVTAGPNNGTQVREYIVGTRTDAWSNSRFDTAEVLAFNDVLSDAERDTVEDYFNVKYFGGTFELPANITITSKSDELTLTGTISDFEGLTFDGAGDIAATTAHQQLAGSDGTVTKTGDGTLTVTADNTYSGGTTVMEGTLEAANTTGSATGIGDTVVNDGATLLASNPSGSAAGTTTVTIEDGGILAGTGSIAGATLIVQSGGTIQPGSGGFGTLGIGGANTFETGSTYLAELSNAPANDVLAVTGAVDLSNFDLDLVLSGGPIVTGSTFLILDNDGGDAVVNGFAGLTEGSLLALDDGSGGLGELFRITYTGGDGNDVVVEALGEVATTEILIDASGNLVINDIDDSIPGGGSTGDSSDEWHISVVGSEVVVTGDGNLGTVIAGATHSNLNEVRVDTGLFTGDVIVNGLSGNDAITVGDLGDMVLPAGLTVNGDDGFDNILYNGTGSVLAAGGNAEFNAEEIEFQFSDLTATDGDITVNGTGGTGSTHQGIHLYDTDLAANGAGNTITLNGSGGDTGNSNQGVFLTDGSTISTTDGNIDIDGQGGGDAASVAGQGVMIYSGSSLSAGGSGTITIDGTGGPGTYQNDGVLLDSGTSATVENGDMTITGTGGGTLGGSNGVSINDAGLSGTGTGNITISGTSAATGGSDNRGVKIQDSTINTTGGSGSITISGSGSDAGKDGNMGVSVRDTAITAGGSGAVSIDGTGGSGEKYNHGVHFDGAGSSITSVSGAITINGTANGTLGFNRGIKMGNVTVTTGGGITLVGTGSASGSGEFNTGILLNSSNLSGGTLTITGHGGTGSSFNDGVRILEGSLSGTLVLDGTANPATTGVWNTGVYLLNVGLGSATGTITGTGGGGMGFNHGIYRSPMPTGLTENGSTTDGKPLSLNLAP